MIDYPESVNGLVRVDDRGIVSAINQVDFSKVKRIYMVENFNTDTVRAFHGHKIEEKQALVVSGSALFVFAKMGFPEWGGAPSLHWYGKAREVASAKAPKLIQIPAGWANGFKALEPNTKILFFSSTSLEEAALDDYRFPWDELDAKIWEVANR